ncbi:MAG: hypothetical protein EPO16_06945 [Dehalococcoidia bacterium]|nr:MAG: hypothetical protein EPO16_06945 [Dehalococcoidia bacterium]
MKHEEHAMFTGKRTVIGAAALLTTLVLLADGVMGGTGTASADAGPHGGFTATGGSTGGLPDQCAGCHRVHQGQSSGKLLKAVSPFALCLTCHNGSGSVLDVLDGVRLNATIAPVSGTIRQADNGTLTLSVAPEAAVSVPAGEAARYRLAIRNSAGATTASVTLGTMTGATTQFGAAYFNNTPGTTSVSGLALAAAPSTTYVDLAIPSITGATETSAVLLPVTVTAGTSTPEVKLSARVRAAADVYTSSGNAILNGGGFMFVGGAAVTSRHNADPADSSTNPWGYNANTGQNTNALSAALQCTSCHNPHGSNNYRILKESVNSLTVNVKAWYDGAFTKQEGARGLESGAPADKYIKEYYASSGDSANGGKGDPGIGSLCGACHTAYPSTGARTAYTQGGTTHYRHRTEMPFANWMNPDTGRTSQNPETQPLGSLAGQAATWGVFPALRLASNVSDDNSVVTCLTCHRVHGSASTMDGYALKSSVATALNAAGATRTGRADEDLTPSQTTSDHTGKLSESTLLFTNNRGMCQACHQWGVQ